MAWLFLHFYPNLIVHILPLVKESIQVQSSVKIIILPFIEYFKKIKHTMLFITKHFLSLFSILRLRWMDHWFKLCSFVVIQNFIYLMGTVLTQILILIFSPSECDRVTDSDSRSGVCCVSTGICKFYKLHWNI